MIQLPFPPSALSGHNKGHWAPKRKAVQQWREWARIATLEVKPWIPDEGDITVSVLFIPPNNRGDRTNFPIRMKPIFDGIADALKVNDKRFLPRFLFGSPEAPGRVEVRLG